MVKLASRRAFLRSFAPSEGRRSIRPPGSDPARFEELCRDCDRCLGACPEKIIVADGDGRAVVDFERGGCTFCGACAESCPTRALDPARLGDWPWRAAVAESCLSMNGVACRACQDACDARAIRFRLRVGGRADPSVDLQACTGCGACAGACPIGAIAFETTGLGPGEAAA